MSNTMHFLRQFNMMRHIYFLQLFAEQRFSNEIEKEIHITW